MEFIFDSRSQACKTPFGCIPKGQTLSVTVYVKDVGCTDVFFHMEKDGEQTVEYTMKYRDKAEGYMAYNVELSNLESGLYFYHFSVRNERGCIPIFKDRFNRPSEEQGDKWQFTCYDDTQIPSQDFYGKVIYQIFPDRFNRVGYCDTKDKLTPFYIHENEDDLPEYRPDANGEIKNNDFFGGNLQGIIQKLPYLSSLGVGVVYLNPIFMAFSSHRYDTADYLRIDPLLGTKEDFEELCKKAHEYHIKVILDGVFSHTGSDSLYFDKHNRFGNGAYHHPDSPYRSWYQFTGNGNEYTAWWGIETLPCVNETNLDFMDYIVYGENSVVKHWLRAGADGWRLDVADELPDEFLAALYKTVKAEKENSLVIGEVWEDASNKISYGRRRRYLQGGILDSVMNYVWRNAIIRFARRELTAEEFNEEIFRLYENYPEHAVHVMMNALSTHDTVRIINALAPVEAPKTSEERANFSFNEQDYRIAQDRLYVASFLQFTLPGMASIYYGDEIGMQGFEDPFNRAYMGEKKGDDAILKHYIALSRIKDECDALRLGKLMPAFCGNGVFGFYRRHHNETVFCVVNCGNTAQNVGVPKGELLFSKKAKHSCDGILLLPDGCAVFSPANGNATCSTVQ